MSFTNCPECGSADAEGAGWTPMQGEVFECRDCRWVGTVEDFTPTPEELDRWIETVYGSR